MPRQVVALKVDGEPIPRVEWLTARRAGIGSSDVGAICGFSRHGSPLSVYLDKIGDADEEPETARMRMGRLLEPVIASEFEDATGYVTVEPEFMYGHDEFGFMLASPDREVRDVDGNIVGGLEAKTYTGRGDRWDDDPPNDVVLQVTHQLLVMGWTRAWVGLLKHGWEFHHWPIVLDPLVAEMLTDIETSFWEHVTTRQPPPVDGHPATTEALSRLYRQVNAGERVALDDIETEVLALKAVRENKAALEARERSLANTIKGHLGHADIGTLAGDDVVTWRPSSAFDEERFLKEHPLIAAKYSRLILKDLEAGGHKKLAGQYRTEGAGPRRLAYKKGKP